MSFFRIFDVSGSAMSAQNTRLNTVASNLANAEVVSSNPETAYRSKQPIFATALQQAGADAAASLVRVTGITESARPPRAEYAPEHPLANEQGYVYRSNVNAAEEMANMISASRSYQNTVEVMGTAKQLLLSTLRLGQQ